MLQSLNETQLLITKAYENLHLYEHNSTLNACLTEDLIVKKMGGDKAISNQPGYDYTHPKYGRVELKTTFLPDSRNAYRLQVSGLREKKGNCDHVHIVDFYNGGVHFMLPHDEVFEDMKLHTNGDVLRWSSTYNIEDNVMTFNTASMLAFQLGEDIFTDDDIEHDLFLCRTKPIDGDE